MKKIKLLTILMLMLIVTTFNCFALTYKDSLKKELELEGFVSVYHNVHITKLSETGNLGYGMPFDITDSEVQYNALNQNLGRLIAKWDFSSTISKLTIKIKASPMVHAENSTKILDYYISFKYKFAKFNSDGSYNSDEVGYILTNSRDNNGATVIFKNEVDQDSFPIIASSQQDIRFMFMDGVNPASSDYPAGFYTAMVTIELIGE